MVYSNTQYDSVGWKLLLLLVLFVIIVVLLLKYLQNVPQMEFMSLVFTGCCFFTHMPVRVTVGDLGLCCCTCVTYFEC